ncbi:hypothetical protein Clacol_008086 [Clathrus columnatus]|uniref:Uncharacterized protein n=1 Tax=Clathrus columnatus TaxID=1419009 RepID=A0AAV5AGR6_9AGAM|nr:hypothetical protein Clacol_008086 [Clathrus columnatus]
MAAVADWQMDSENSTTTTGTSSTHSQPNQTHSPYQTSPSSSSSPHHPQWQPSPQAQPFYPSYPPFFAHPAPPQNPYFDPNQHFAQWAYQQMMFNAQAQAQVQAQAQFQQAQAQAVAAATVAQAQILAQPGTRSATPPQQQSDYFSRSTEPFHPYPRRPQQRQHSLNASSSSSSSWQHQDNTHRPVVVPSPPYARDDAAGSSSSLNSASSGRSRKGSNVSSSSPITNNVAHNRTVSSTSRTSTTSVERPASIRSVSTSATNPDARRPSKPSPLSQPVTNAASPSRPSFSSTIRAESPTTPKTASPNSVAPDSTAPVLVSSSSSRPTHHKRLSISKDDSQLGDPTPVPDASIVRSGGLKGRLRRALSFNASSTLEGTSDKQAGEDEKDTKLNSRRKALANANKHNASSSSANSSKSPSPFTAGLPDDDAPPTPIQEPPQESKSSRPRRSLFNSKINASTDNISLSSTVSSASVMIRKLGSLSVGRLARKNSLMSITSLFKDKKSNLNGSASASQASVTHATAEVDRVGVGADGLSPAAEIVRQHTLKVKNNEEAAARRKAEEEIREKTRQAQAQQEANNDGVPVWERGTANRKGKRIGEYVYDEDEPVDQHQFHRGGNDSGSEDDSDGTYSGHGHRDMERISRGWQDLDLDDDEDITIRVNQHPQIHSQSNTSLISRLMEIMLPVTEQDADEAWAIGIRRSVERTKRPTKGILKIAAPVPLVRVRSNSYNHGASHEPGPLAKIPDPDPDHIDGLHHHRDKSVNGDYLPPFSFDDAPVPRSSSPGNGSINSSGHSVFNLPVNSSAPALSTFTTRNNATVPLRPKGPQKKLAFAANLSVYDTFSASVYDRRSEPATCNRLTPALAQRIKEELNSYKMEEMEVHALSRGQ